MPKRYIVALLILVILAGAVAVRAATPGQVTQSNRRAAAGAAAALLGQVVLPAGATRIADEPAGDAHQLRLPVEGFYFAAEVNRHQFWVTTASPSEVIASVQAHLPAGASVRGTGSVGGSSGVTGEFGLYSLPAVSAPALGARSLVVDAVRLTDRRTGVRADAVVPYSAPRVPSQRVPSGPGVVLRVTVAKPGSQPLLSLVVTRRDRVRRIAATVDSLPFVASLRGVAFSCPSEQVVPAVTFTFRRGLSGPVLGEVSEPADTPTLASPCALTALTVRGHREPGLLEGGVLLRKAGQILGVRLTSRR